MNEYWWVSPAIAVASLIVAIVSLLTRNLSPRLTTRFSCPGDDPAALDCEISNEGRGMAKDVFLTFGEMLPMGTVLFADPELRAEMVESDTPPDPVAMPLAASLQRAFSIKIPRIAPKDTVQFQVRTTDPDNIRAAVQIRRIRDEIQQIIHQFGMRLRAEYPNLHLPWDEAAILSSRIKDECFFSPLRLSDDHGRYPVTAHTEQEILAKAQCQDVYARFKAQFIDIFQGRPQFIAPVVRIKTRDGDRTRGVLFPYVNSSLHIRAAVADLQQKGSQVVYPLVPSSYDEQRGSSTMPAPQSPEGV
jgi:hypothetical protein